MAILPSACTLGNVLCGFAAVFFASRPQDTVMLWNWTPLTIASVCVFVGMAFDALDGRLARMTHQTSDLGGQLDSMADMVTFGLAPAFLTVQLVNIGAPFLSEKHDTYLNRTALVVAGIYVACAALRLARFNIEVNLAENKDHMSFKGMPSPGAAGTVVSLILLHQHLLAHQVGDTMGWLSRTAAIGIVPITLLVAFGMVSRLRYAHVLNRYIRGRARFGNFVKAMIVLMLLLISPHIAVATAFVFYALSAPAAWVWRSINKGRFNTEAQRRGEKKEEDGITGSAGFTGSDQGHGS